MSSRHVSSGSSNLSANMAVSRNYRIYMHSISTESVSPRQTYIQGETGMSPTITTDRTTVRSKLQIRGVRKLSMLRHVCADEDASSLEGIRPILLDVVLPQWYV